MDAAIAELKACVAIAPRDEKGYELLGYSYLQTEVYTEAREVYGHLVETRPESAVYRNSLGVVYMMLEKPRPAIVQFETAARLAPNNPQVYRNLANAYRQIGEQEKAAKAYQRYRSRNETHREQSRHARETTTYALSVPERAARLSPKSSPKLGLLSSF